MDSAWVGKHDEVNSSPGEWEYHRQKLRVGHSGMWTWDQEKYGLTVILNPHCASDRPEEFFLKNTPA